MRWFRRLRGALGMGVSWAVGWTLAGILIGLSSFVIPMGWFAEVFDAPLFGLGVIGFFGGSAFSVVLGVAGRRRRFDELSIPGFTALGVLGGLLLGAVPVTAALTGGTVTVAGAAVAMGTLTILSAASAAGTLAVARMSEDRELLAASEDVADVGLSDVEAKELLGRGG